jgi:hypothetical protein
MSCESRKYYNGTYMQVLQKMLKISNYLWTYAGTVRILKNQLLNLYVGITYLK